MAWPIEKGEVEEDSGDEATRSKTSEEVWAEVAEGEQGREEDYKTAVGRPLQRQGVPEEPPGGRA